ncbi:MAG: hypothetical protein HY722_00980 [Planctomycetes bacterium]|nr:hypothetical protein [Planctomycetota bacterium]
MGSRLATVLVAALLGPAPGGDPAGDADLLWGFASSLEDEGEYYRAVTEFWRFRHSFPAEARADEARYRVARCHARGDRLAEARALFLALADEEPPGPWAGAARLGAARAAYQGEDYETAATQAQRLRGGPLESDGALLAGWARLRQGRWREAETAFPITAEGLELTRRAPEGETLGGPSPWVAAGLSALVPGLGQTYAGRPGDGLVAFALNAAFAVGAVQAFAADQDALGAVLGTLEVGWYAGNVITAAGAARRGVERRRRGFLRELEAIQGPPDYAESGEGPGLSLAAMSF